MNRLAAFTGLAFAAASLATANPAAALTTTVYIRVSPDRQWQCGAGFPTGPHSGPATGFVSVGSQIVWRFDFRNPADCAQVVAITRDGAENDRIPITVTMLSEDGKSAPMGAGVVISANVREVYYNIFVDRANGEPVPPGESISATPQAPAAETALVDRWNTAGCGFTDRAPLSLSAPAHLTRLDLWFNWAAQERAVGYVLERDGRQVAAGELTRAECDPYQSAWCVARATPEIDLAPGLYSIRTARPGLCQNAGSGGAGFLRAFGR